MNYYDVSRANVTAIYDTPTSNDSSYDISRANVTATSIAAYLARLPILQPNPGVSTSHRAGSMQIEGIRVRDCR